MASSAVWGHCHPGIPVGTVTSRCCVQPHRSPKRALQHACGGSGPCPSGACRFPGRSPGPLCAPVASHLDSCCSLGPCLPALMEGTGWPGRLTRFSWKLVRHPGSRLLQLLLLPGHRYGPSLGLVLCLAEGFACRLPALSECRPCCGTPKHTVTAPPPPCFRVTPVHTFRACAECAAVYLRQSSLVHGGTWRRPRWLSQS